MFILESQPSPCLMVDGGGWRATGTKPLTSSMGQYAIARANESQGH